MLHFLDGNNRAVKLPTYLAGVIDVEDVKGVYNASNHPDVRSGRKSGETILNEFLTNFEGPGGTKDGKITVEEFESYYSNISASIDDDDYFELMLRNAWHISGGKGSYANSTNRRVLVTHDDGRQSVEEIKNDIGLRSNDAAGIANRLKAQNISASKVNTSGAVDGTQGSGRGADQSGQPITQKQLQSQYQQQQQSRQQQALERQQPRPHGRLQQPQDQYQIQPQHQLQYKVQPERLNQYQQSPRGSSSGSVSSYGSSSQRMRPKSLGEHLQ